MRYKHDSNIASVNLALIRLPRSTLCKYSPACLNEKGGELSMEDEEGDDCNRRRST